MTKYTALNSNCHTPRPLHCSKLLDRQYGIYQRNLQIPLYNVFDWRNYNKQSVI